jgi:hypothetical protein
MLYKIYNYAKEFAYPVVGPGPIPLYDITHKIERTSYRIVNIKKKKLRYFPSTGNY